MKDIIKSKAKHFEVALPNEVGTLSKLTDCLALNGVNIKAISSEARGTEGIMNIVTKDENTARKSLQKAGFSFKESDILILRLLDRPGELSKVAKLLAKEGVNVESIYIVGSDLNKGETEIALKVNDMFKAREILGGVT